MSNQYYQIPAIDRFLCKIDKISSSPCWLWTGHLIDGKYGQFYDGKNKVYAHRWIYEHTYGSIDEDLDVHHTCYVTRCVNPAHLEERTQRDNILDIDASGPCAINHRKIICNKGHELIGDNVMVRPNGKTNCRQCNRYSHVLYKYDNLAKDNHDFFTDEHVATFLRNCRTGEDNLGRHFLASIVRSYDNPVVIDCAAGTAVNYSVFKNLGVSCRYIAFDRTRQFLDHAKKLHGSEILYHRGYIQQLPYADNFADIIILRHIGEHVLPDDFYKAIKEAYRVAKKEVVVVMFLDLSDNSEHHIDRRGPDDNDCYYYWNTYSQDKFMDFLTTLGCQIKIDYVSTPGAAANDTIIRLIK